MELLKLYAPSGTAKRNKRERFYNTEHPLLLRAEYRKIILVVTSIVYSRFLSENVKGLALKDTWNRNPLRHKYTHLSSSGATKIDAYTATRPNGEKLPSKFYPPPSRTIRHLCYALQWTHLSWGRDEADGRWTPRWYRKKYHWKISHEWELWKRHKQYDPVSTMWF